MFKVALRIGFLLLLVVGCKKEYVTQVAGPKDWQPPEVSWMTPPEAELRGTVGLDVRIADSSRIARAVLYFDGLARDTLTASPWRFTLHTDSATIGIHLVEARAWDEYGNMGVSPILRVYSASGIPEGIRLLWVPDNYTSIQAAINAATDFDTIRVRDGIYYETLNTFGKGIWIESEHGPMRCTIDAEASFSALFLPPNSTPCTVRGFRLSSAGQVVNFLSGSQINLFNNIILPDSAEGVLITGYIRGNICNNLFANAQNGVQISYCLGSFYNNILMSIENTAFWNAAIYENPLIYGYNLFWHNGTNYGERFEPGIGDIVANPLLDMVTGELLRGSPAIDAGNPSMYDNDSTRSDIGPWGGLWAYHN